MVGHRLSHRLTAFMGYNINLSVTYLQNIWLLAATEITGPMVRISSRPILKASRHSAGTGRKKVNQFIFARCIAKISSSFGPRITGAGTDIAALRRSSKIDHS
jgi:hypothetical protein